MLRFFHKISSKSGGLHEAAYLLAFFTFVSQLLGLFRDRLLSGTFGAGETLDVYYAAFKVPDLIFVTVASLVSISILVPFFSREASDDTKRLVNGIFTFFIFLVVTVSLIAFIFAPTIMPFVFPGITLERMGELIMLSRIMLLSPILLGISNFFGSIAQVEGRFLLYAISPVLYNTGIIIGIVFLYPIIGMYGLAFGVILGAFLHGLIYWPFLLREHRLPRLSLTDFKSSLKEVKDVARLSLPRAFALSASSLAILVLLSLASLVAPGSIAAFTLSFNLHTIPFAIIGVSYASAVFPLLSRLARAGDKVAFEVEVKTVARQIIFFTLPAATLFFVFSEEIVRVIFATGEFNATDVALVSALLKVFAIAVVPQSLIALFVRVFYAQGQTARPFFLNLTSAVTVCLFGFGGIYLFTNYLSFSTWIESWFGLTGIAGSATLTLALAFVFGSFLNMVLHALLIGRGFPMFLHSLKPTIVRGIIASVFLGTIAVISVHLYINIFKITTTLGIFIGTLGAGLTGILGGVASLYFMQSEELRDNVKTFKRKFFKINTTIPDELPL